MKGKYTDNFENRVFTVKYFSPDGGYVDGGLTPGDIKPGSVVDLN